MDIQIKDLKGAKFSVVHCDGAIESFYETIAKHPKNKRERYTAQMLALITRLADGGRMSNENFPQEGELPDKSHFRALKKIPIRAYIWQSKKTPNTYYISHYIYKDFDKLKDSDTDKVCKNWNKIEGKHYEKR